ncbi:MAG: tyrosine-type recombinase/integrase [Syntrophobacteraceae bacterium]|jgi:site-specific recombinase XerD
MVFPFRQTRNPAKEVFEKLSSRLKELALPGIEYAEQYLFHLYSRNRRPNTLELNYTSIRFFLEFLKANGITCMEAVSRKDIAVFIEHEQDRGMKPVSIRGRLGSVKAFLRYLIEDGVVRHEVLSKSISVKVPDALPKAIAPEDVRALLSVIENTRNRALVLMLLRTGMRIGELLSLRVQDIDVKEQKVFIHEARKTGVGRVVYFSADAKEALVAWLKKKDPREDVLAYGKKYESITYAAARLMFVRCLKKAGLLHKGYTLHCLRHTFASELLNAGMRLECLQPLLGHTSVEVTRRYARLTDKTREQEYFRAMALIEKGEIHGNYRFDHRL